MSSYILLIGAILIILNFIIKKITKTNRYTFSFYIPKFIKSYKLINVLIIIIFTIAFYELFITYKTVIFSILLFILFGLYLKNKQKISLLNLIFLTSCLLLIIYTYQLLQVTNALAIFINTSLIDKFFIFIDQFIIIFHNIINLNFVFIDFFNLTLIFKPIIDTIIILNIIIFLDKPTKRINYLSFLQSSLLPFGLTGVLYYSFKLVESLISILPF